MNAHETPLRARIVAELEKVESSTARRLANLLGMESQPSLVLVELQALEKDGLVERTTKRGSREPWYFLTNKVSTAAQAAPQPAVGNTGSAVSGTTTPEGRAVAEKTPGPESDPPPNDEGSGGNVMVYPDSDAAICARIERLSADVAAREDGFLQGTFMVADLLALVQEEVERERAFLINVITDIREAIGDEGQTKLRFLADRIRKIYELGEDRHEAIARLRAELATERQAREALQEQINAEGVDVLQAMHSVMIEGAGYNGDRRPVRNKLADAVKVGQARVRSGKDRRVRIFARVLLGEIVAGAEWRPAK